MIYTKHGFTLIELMVTISIVIILALIAVPLFSSTIFDTQSESDIRALANDLQFAQMAAYRQGREIKVCSSTASAVTPVCNNSSDWSAGWLVIDTTTNKTLRKGIPLTSSGLTGIYEGENTSPTADGVFLFGSKGFAQISPSSATYGYISADGLRVCVYVTGHISLIRSSSC